MAFWAIWLVIGILLIIAEMATLTFYLLWLALGSLAAALVALILPDAIVLQVFIGIVVALLLTLFTKQVTRRMRNSRGFTDVIYQLVGLEGLVMEDIPQEGLGIVKVGNETWSAQSEVPLSKGTPIIVVQSYNTILQVQKREDV
ncbi:NfeD family protein [Paenibacillus psychroresistens]|uniref:NfeD family protein n=1 Tax=Paenibacillus psychroresistens TaxID=1778678 RepID=A0A6B8RC27_9BACL|nr:NfeD family protein [Paenibacillus psychroresistens]QGQ94081.1 NfeD family protein [Paenibacillus psychroresistens]